ncbi:glycoside hydrolase family 36 protein [Marispirochaeta aestuarii]|uniref:glycoside hydrolase family 36 protein n=1 Tax=Marispirochaeta aestuarii TaxID=1963862 RepID=UPI002ABDA483|nr:glycoside hydrolase family 36 protein [Marispirochaeta aestuarii]
MRFIPENSSVVYSRHQHTKTPQSLSGRWPQENDDLKLVLEEERENESPRYRFVLSARRDLFIRTLSLTGRLEGTLRPVSLLSEGGQSRSYVEILGPADRQISAGSPWVQTGGKSGEHVSSGLVLLSDGLNPDLILAQEAPFQEYTSFTVHSGRQPVRISLTWHVERAVEAAQVYSTGWTAQSSGTGELLLREWSIRNAEKLPAMTAPKQEPPMLCCPMQRRSTEPTVDYLRRQLNAAREKQIPFDVIMIEEGWQRSIGDWTGTSEQFGADLPRISREIGEAGFTPGLWLAPFVAARESDLFANPGWLLRNEKGKPVEADCCPRRKTRMFALDITHPEVAEHIAGIIRTLTREWGFKYLKLDFLEAASLKGKRHNDKLTPAQILSRGLQQIREAAGDDVHLAGSGLPFPAGAGVLDSVNVSPEILPQQKKARLSRMLNARASQDEGRFIQNLVLRSHLNRTFWFNDAAYLSFLYPGAETGTREAEELCTAVTHSGGSLFVSDDLSLYGEQEIARIKSSVTTARELSTGQTTPLRIFSDPGICTVYNDQGCIVIFNLNQTESTIELRLSPYRKLLEPYNSYRPFEGAEDHPLEAPRNITLKPREYKRILLRSV